VGRSDRAKWRNAVQGPQSWGKAEAYDQPGGALELDQAGVFRRAYTEHHLQQGGHYGQQAMERRGYIPGQYC